MLGLSFVRARRQARPPAADRPAGRTFRPLLETLEDRASPGSLWQMSPFLPSGLEPFAADGDASATRTASFPGPAVLGAAEPSTPTSSDAAVAAGAEEGQASGSLPDGSFIPPDAGADPDVAVLAGVVRNTADGPVVFVGDSITAFGSAPDGFVTLVTDRLHASAPGPEVINAGHGGDAVPDLQARLDCDVLAHAPSQVFVEIGINDVWRYEQGAASALVPPDRYEAGLRDVLGRIQAAGAQVVLATPTVIGERADSVLLDQYAGISRRVAQDMGVAVCDLHQTFRAYLAANNPSGADAGILTVDRVHLSPAGNALVADAVMGSLRV